jgi:hypothetical protein
MLIHVNYPDNRYDYVKDTILHGLIESGKIARFKRYSGWATVGVDPVRKVQRDNNTSRIKSHVRSKS